MATILVRPTFFPSATLISRPSLRQMAISSCSSSSSSSSSFSSFPEKRNKLPILLFDVMDTIVRDPFYQDIPAFFGMPFKELLEMKHPTAWLEFEEGLIDEVYLAMVGKMDLAKKFFKDGRPLDVEGLKECMRQGYSYVDGVEALLQSLKRNNYEMHAFTNYPIWYTLIEEKLKISKYLSWTFCSCKIGKRKPAVDSYLEVLHRLGVEPASCIFIDDRVVNIEAAVNVGMTGLHFKNAACLQRDLSLLGIETGSLSTN